MPADGIISLYSKLHDVSFVRTDNSPVQQGDVPLYQTSASKLYMGPGGSGGGGTAQFSLGVSNIGNTAGQTGITGTRIVLAGGGAITLSQLTDATGATITASAPASSLLSAVAPLSTSVSGSTISLLGPPSFSAGVSDSGNSAGATGVTGSRLVLVGSNNITLSQATDASGATISLFGGAGASAGIAGVANSQTTYTSGTVRLSELGAVTIRSTTGNQFQISVNPQSVQPETQTFLGGLAASNTTYTSGTVTLVGSGDITVQSGTGQRIIISGSQSVQAETQTFVGGVGNSQTTYTSGTVNISGLANITVRSTTGQALQLSVAAQSVQPETQTFVAGLAASDTTYTSGTVRITGVGGGVTVSSNTGQRIDISVAAPVAQTVQTQNLHNVTLSGNTAGVLAQISSGTMTLAGGNNITVSQNGNAVTISGPNVGGAQTGISAIANSETTYTSGSITLSELGAITIRSTTGQRFQFSVDPQSNQSLGMYAVGNTTGESSSTTRDARTLSLRGDGIVSVGYSNGSVRISASQSVQPETQTFLAGVIASDTTYTSGSVRFTGVGGGITVSSNTGQRVDLSVAAQSVQPGIQQLVVSNTTFSSGTVSLSGFGEVTVNTAANIIRVSAPVQTAESQSIGMSNIGNTSGTTGIASGAQVRFLLAGGNNVTLSQSLNGASGTLTISAANQTVQTQNVHNVTLSGNTAGVMAQISSGTMTLAGGNNITVSQNGNAVTISGANIGGAQTGISGIANSQTTYTSGTVSLSELGAITIRSTTGNQFQLSVNSQTDQTLGLYALGNTTGESSSTTRDARTLSFRGDGIVSVGYSNGSVRISASQSVQPETQTFVGGIAASDTTYTSGTVRITGVGGGITVSSNTGQRIDLSVAAQSAESQSIGMSNVGNTSGTTGMASGAQVRMVLAGGNNVTLSQSLNGASGTITISAGGGAAFSAGVSTDGNTAGATGVTGTRLVFVGEGVMSLSQTTGAGGGTVSIQAPASSLLSAVSPLSTSTNGSTISILAPDPFSAGFSTQGNTAGDTGFASQRLALVGSNNITLSGSTNGGSQTISILGASGAAFSGGVSNVGNTSGDTGITGTRLVLAGGQSITLSQSTNASGGTVTISGASTSQSVQTLGMYALGNTVGESSSTTRDARTISIRGDGIVSVGYSNGSLRISASQSVQPETQTAISGLANSQTTYTSGTVSLSELGAITIRSTTGNQFQLSVNAQTAESQSIGMSNIGNTSGTTGIASGAQVRMLFAGGNNVTLSQSLNGASGTITISAFNQSTQPGVQQFVVSDTTFSSGTVSISGFGDVTVNTAANIIRISAPVQTVESQSIGMSNLGNTSGTTGIASGAQVRMLFAGGNNITLSQSLNGASGTITISAPNAATGISGVANSQTTYTSGTVSLSELGAITIRSTTGNQYQFSVNSQTVQTQNLHNVTLSGNTAGVMAQISSGTMTLAGGNNVTLSQNGNAVTISAGGGAETQTAISGIANSQTTYTSGTVSLSELGAITIRSTTGNQFQLSVNAQSTQPGIQHLVVSNTTFSSGTVSLSGFGDVTVNTAANIIRISAPVQTAQTGISGLANSQTTYTSGTVSLSELGAITIRSTTGNQFQLSVNAQTAQTGISGLANSQTTYTSGTVSLSELGAITIRSTTGNQFQLSVNAQTGTQFSAGLSNVGNTSGDTVTVGGRLILAGGNGITLSGSSNGVSQTITISGVTQSVESQSIGASNLGNTLGTSGVASGGQVRAIILGTSNITVSQSVNGASASLSLIGQPPMSAGVSTGGNTSGQTGITGTRLILAGGNNITLSQATDANGGTVTISAPNLGAGAMSVGVSTGGNTAGATGITGTQLVLVGTNNISLSQTTGANGGTVSISGQPAFSAGVSTGGNTAGATGLTGTQMVFVGSSPLSLSQTTGANGGTITINAPATSSLVGTNGVSISTNGSTISVLLPTASSYAPYDESPMVTGQQGAGTVHFAPVRLPNLQFDRIALGVQVSNATNSSGSFSLSYGVGIYTQNVSTLSLLISTSITTNFTMSGTAGSYSRIGGPRHLTIPWTTTLTGSDYWIGLVSRTTSGGANVSVSQLLLSKFTTDPWSGIMGTASQSTDQRLLGLGVWSVSSSSVPNSAAFTNILGTGSIVLRAPIWHLRSGTV